MDLKFYLIDTRSYLQKNCKQKWDSPQKSLQIEKSGYYGLIIPRAPKGALFLTTCLQRVGQATCTAMAMASGILWASKTDHSSWEHLP